MKQLRLVTIRLVFVFILFVVLYKAKEHLTSGTRHNSFATVETHFQDLDDSISEEVPVQLQRNDSGISELLTRVQDRIHTCLDATGMKDYFEQEGLLNTSLTTAAVFVKRIRELIPGSFLTGTPNHCWAKNVSLKVKNHGSEYEAWGAYGDIKFSFRGKPYSRTLTHKRPYYQTGSGDSLRESMVCLPQVFLLGFAKCGSTHLYTLLCQHPMVVKPRTKEPHWWQHAEFFTQDISRNSFFFADYLMMFKELVLEMLKTHNFKLLSVEGSPNTLYSAPAFGGNHPIKHYCLLPAVFPEILPRSKYLVVMRNPVDMLYSAFWFSCMDLGVHVPQNVQLKGPNIFHERVLIKINSFKSCIQDFPLVKCVLDMTEDIFTQEMHCGRTRLEMGVYYVHILKWLSVVPRSEFLFLTLEELSADTSGTMAKVWQFLDLPHMTLGSDHEHEMNTQTRYDYHYNPRLAMREDTRKLLVDFFAPYNRMLADFLGNDKFLWST